MHPALLIFNIEFTSEGQQPGKIVMMNTHLPAIRCHDNERAERLFAQPRPEFLLDHAIWIPPCLKTRKASSRDSGCPPEAGSLSPGTKADRHAPVPLTRAA
jgi:hypothetical protein